MACKNGEDTYGDYATIVAAKLACDDDPNCGKVCDKYCDGRVLTLCVMGTEETPSNDLGSCLYKHERDSKCCKFDVLQEITRYIYIYIYIYIMIYMMFVTLK